MKKSKRMQPILRIAESKEKRAAIALGEAQSQLQMHIARLQELQNYQNEYINRFQQNGQNGVEISMVLSFKSFLEKLNQAIEQQKETVATANQLVENCKQHWFASRGQVKMYNNVITRFQSEETEALEKQEQKDLDERAQRVLNQRS